MVLYVFVLQCLKKGSGRMRYIQDGILPNCTFCLKIGISCWYGTNHKCAYFVFCVFFKLLFDCCNLVALSFSIVLVGCVCMGVLSELMDSCRAVGRDALAFLSVLKLEKPGSGKIASGANDLQKTIRSLQRNTSVSG